jgi:hypothetical protein
MESKYFFSIFTASTKYSIGVSFFDSPVRNKMCFNPVFAIPIASSSISSKVNFDLLISFSMLYPQYYSKTSPINVL